MAGRPARLGYSWGIAYLVRPGLRPANNFFMKKRCLLFLTAGVLCAAGMLSAAPFPRDYRFGGGRISEKVLKNYLSRSITMAEVCTGLPFLVDGPYPYREDDWRMLRHIGAKFIGRSLYLWGGEDKVNDPRFWTQPRALIAEMHHSDADVIFQACIFEIITTRVNAVPVPAWVFAAFDLPAEARHFRYDSMLNRNGKLVDHWSAGASVPDITRRETQMWFYFLARHYIDIGIEAIHFGQVELMAMEDRDQDYRSWWSLLSRARAYAAGHARRGTLLCDGHVPGGGIVSGGRLLLDFHSFPSRPENLAGKPRQAVLSRGYLDAFYGRSRGGITPSGWSCAHLPYLVELDNFGISPHPGQAAHSYFVWGYDEISWFALQPEAYRNAWLRYAWQWVRRTDPEGFLEMPGSRVVTGLPRGRGRRYRANMAGEACPPGYGQEDTIRAIWSLGS